MKISFPVIAIFLFSTLVTALACGLFFFQLYTDLEDRTEQDARTFLTLSEQKFKDVAEQAELDLQYLASLTLKSSFEKMGNHYSHFAEYYADYFQVRFLDTEGREYARVNRTDNGIEIVSETSLQNKRHRYYFEKTFSLPRDKVYVSPLDLNIEHFAIEVPFKPTIRFGLHLFDSLHQSRGALIVNYHAKPLLEELRDLAQSYSGELILLNQKGEYLVSPVKEKQWSFMFTDSVHTSFAQDHPLIWSKMNEQKFNALVGEAGTFYFQNIVFDPDRFQCHKGCHWKVVTFYPRGYLKQKTFDEMMSFYLLFLVFWGLVFSAAYSIYLYRIKQVEHRNRNQQLLESIEQERRLFLVGPTVIFKLKNQFSWPVSYVSDNVEEVLGFEADTFTQGHLSFAGMITAEDLETFTAEIQQAVDSQQTSFEVPPFRVVNKAGQTVKQAEEQLEESALFMQTVVDAIPDPTLVIDTDSYEVILHNRAAKELYARNTVFKTVKCYQLSHAASQPCSGEDHPCPIKEIQKTHRSVRTLHKHYSHDGKELDIEVVASPVFDKNGQLVKIIESHRDITHHIRSEKVLAVKAETDALTQTFNRNKLNEVLNQVFSDSFSTASEFSVMMFDLDHFKQINDNYGHDIGDLVLKKVTSEVKALLRREDILGRWGGEEFLILLKTSNRQALLHRAEMIRQAISELQIPPIGFVTTSVGVAMRTEADTAETLVKRADIALYQAKKNGRNRVEMA